MVWKFAYGTVAGSRHKKQGISCQDSCDVRVFYTRSKDAVLSAVASDGAGSAIYADTGSKLCCSFVMEAIKDFFEEGNEVFNLTRGKAEDIVLDFCREVKKYGENMGCDEIEYSCTLMCAVVGCKNAVFFQIGDGAMVIQKKGEIGYAPVFWPGKGEYENSTHFAVLPESVKHLKYGLAGGTVCDIAIFTDSLERLALNLRDRCAFQPFFKPLFDEIKTKFKAYDNSLFESITSFLNSQRINKRTDDDKTLIIASRCDE